MHDQGAASGGHSPSPSLRTRAEPSCQGWERGLGGSDRDVFQGLFWRYWGAGASPLPGRERGSIGLWELLQLPWYHVEPGGPRSRGRKGGTQGEGGSGLSCSSHFWKFRYMRHYITCETTLSQSFCYSQMHADRFVSLAALSASVMTLHTCPA